MSKMIDEAYLIHSRPYRDTSLLVDFFTREYGRISAVAKGARSGKSPKSRLLQPFSALQIGWQGKGELKTLTLVERSDLAPSTTRLLGDPLMCGFYLNELLWLFMQHEDPHQQLYECYARVLSQLAEQGEMEPLLRYFELVLLEESGYGLHFDVDENGTEISAEQHYNYSPETGLQRAVDGVLGSVLIQLQEGIPTENRALKTLKRLTRQQIDHLLNGRALKSREIMLKSRHSDRQHDAAQSQT